MAVNICEQSAAAQAVQKGSLFNCLRLIDVGFIAQVDCCSVNHIYAMVVMLFLYLRIFLISCISGLY
jgi:hypothetical protein